MRTGKLELFFGALIFKVRQSSLCTQLFPNCCVFFSVDQGFTGTGALNRKASVGGSAYGMPSQALVSDRLVPTIGPVVVFLFTSSTFKQNKRAFKKAII